MQSIAGMKRYVAGAVAAAALTSSGCAMMEPRMGEYVPPPVGSAWTNGERNTGSYGSGDKQLKVAVGERLWEGRQVFTLARQPQQGTDVITRQGRWLAVLGAGDKPMLRREPAWGFDLALEIGKTWTQSYRSVDAKGESHPFDTTCRVQAYEDVTVPAGTCKAFTASCSYAYGAEEISWLSPALGIWVKRSLKRAPSSPFGAGAQEMELVSQTIEK